ncbi:MAG: NlpC/P60 family protein [Syntrophomonadaceae bacterium]
MKQIRYSALLLLLAFVMVMLLAVKHPSQATPGGGAEVSVRVYSDPFAEFNRLKPIYPDFLHIENYVAAFVRRHDSIDAETSPPGPTAVIHTVKSGDTLWDIALAYNSTVEDLRDLNQLSSDALSLGQTLLVKGPAQGSPKAALQTATIPSRSGQTSRSGEILQYAARYLHTPYVWGGTSPKGFDCSGFVQYVFKHYGYSMPRTAAAQASAGVRVTKSDLMPGDLVFFAMHGSGIDHVGIYAGSGRFIHSSSPGSGGVVYSSLSESAYASAYAGAKRITK